MTKILGLELFWWVIILYVVVIFGIWINIFFSNRFFRKLKKYKEEREKSYTEYPKILYKGESYEVFFLMLNPNYAELRSTVDYRFLEIWWPRVVPRFDYLWKIKIVFQP